MGDQGNNAPYLAAPTGDWGPWLQSIMAYGISRAVDAQYLYPYTTTDKSLQYGQAENGGYYRLGQPSNPVPSSALGLSQHPALLIGAAVVGLGVLYLMLKD